MVSVYGAMTHERKGRARGGDLIMGGGNSAIATIVERHSRFAVLCKVKSKSAINVVQSLTGQMRKLPQQVLKSLVRDRGQELSAHQSFTMVTDIAVYFCNPSTPWQPGTNEDTNGLLRQKFPKGSTLGALKNSWMLLRPN